MRLKRIVIQPAIIDQSLKIEDLSTDYPEWFKKSRRLQMRRWRTLKKHAQIKGQ